MNPTRTDGLSSVFIDDARCPMFVVNAAGKILRTNQRATTQLGMRKGELRGKALSLFLQIPGEEQLPLGAIAPEGGTHGVVSKGILKPPEGEPSQVDIAVQAVDRREPGRYLVLAKESGSECVINQAADTRLREIAEAQERERARIARELHDEALQSLLVAGIEIERLMHGAGLQNGGESLVNLQRLLRGVENDIRQISGRMRSDTVPQCGLLDAVGNAVQTLQSRGLDAEIRFWGTPVPVDPNIQILAYRIVQEALHNVWRHAGATRVRTTVVCRNNRLAIRVTDNGSGFSLPTDLSTKGATEFLGIRGMYERASLMNARLRICPRPRLGTTVSLSIPIEPLV